MRTRRSLVGVLSVLVLAAACGDDSGRAADEPPPDATGATTTTVGLDPPAGSDTEVTEAPEPTPIDPTSPSEIAPPESPAAAATAIDRVERALRDPTTPPEQLAALGWEQQIVYRRLAAEPEWLADALATVPPEVAEIVRANVGGNTSISALVEPPATLPDAWTIVAPPSPDVLRSFYDEAEAASGIPWEYLAAINLVETRMGRIVGDSSAGAQGPMQFIPSSWEAFGEGGDVRDPRASILAAGRYLAAAGGPSDMASAVFAYNHSDDYVDAVTRYAELMQADERAYLGYYHWQVTYRTVDGLWHLPEGYPELVAEPL